MKKVLGIICILALLSMSAPAEDVFDAPAVLNLTLTYETGTVISVYSLGHNWFLSLPTLGENGEFVPSNESPCTFFWAAKFAEPCLGVKLQLESFPIVGPSDLVPQNRLKCLFEGVSSPGEFPFPEAGFPMIVQEIPLESRVIRDWTMTLKAQNSTSILPGTYTTTAVFTIMEM